MNKKPTYNTKRRWHQYKKWSLPSKLTFWGSIFAIISILIALNECHHRSLSERENYKNKLENAKKGVLDDVNYTNAENITIQIGGFRTIFSRAELMNGIGSEKFIACGKKQGQIKVKLQNGNIFLDAKFYNFNNEIVGEIENNEWQLNGNYYKRNYDESAIEVIDNYDVVNGK